MNLLRAIEVKNNTNELLTLTSNNEEWKETRQGKMKNQGDGHPRR